MIIGKIYEGLCFLAQIVLPIIGATYFLLVGSDTIIGTIMIMIFVLNALLWLAQRVYANTRIGWGDLLVEEVDQTGTQAFRLALDQTPEELVTKREVRFLVKHLRPNSERGA